MIYINGSPVNMTHFSDHTSQVWKVKQLDIEDTNWVNIKWVFEHEGEFLQIAQLKTLIDFYNFGNCLHLTYLPFGRQDKGVSNETTFALTSFANMLNHLHFDKIVIDDPHSSVALDLIHNSIAKYPTTEVIQVFTNTRSDMLCYPDKGALTKYEKIYNLPYIYGLKTREQSTGKITAYELKGEPGGGNILIVDDILDGGATFKLLARELLDNKANEVNLFVTHGIFAKGAQTLRSLYDAGIKRVFTKVGEISSFQDQITYRSF